MLPCYKCTTTLQYISSENRSSCQNTWKFMINGSIYEGLRAGIYIMHRLTFVSIMPPLITNFIIYSNIILYFWYPVFYPKVYEVVSSHLNCGSFKTIVSIVQYLNVSIFLRDTSSQKEKNSFKMQNMKVLKFLSF